MAIENIAVVSGLLFAGGILTDTLVDGRTYGSLQHRQNTRYEGVPCIFSIILFIIFYQHNWFVYKISYNIDKLIF